MGSEDGGLVLGRRRFLARMAGAGLAASRATASDSPRPEDDATYRPTVMIRRGTSLGTGTVIASAGGGALVLTASHVVAGFGSILVEVNRFNLGVEKFRDAAGYPKRFEAAVVARDAGADLAILKVPGGVEFPYASQVGRGDATPPVGSPVTSIGFDKGARLVGFATRVRSVDRVDLGKGGGMRPFLITDDPPEVGRSGGGLFRADGVLVGVCVGRIEMSKQATRGLFSTLANIKALIRSDDAVAAAMARATLGPRSPAR